MSNVTISEDRDAVDDGDDIGDDANELSAQSYQQKLREQREDWLDGFQLNPKQMRTKTRLSRRSRH
jgi:hypothetical protein